MKNLNHACGFLLNGSGDNSFVLETQSGDYLPYHKPLHTLTDLLSTPSNLLKPIEQDLVQKVSHERILPMDFVKAGDWRVVHYNMCIFITTMLAVCIFDFRVERWHWVCLSCFE